MVFVVVGVGLLLTSVGVGACADLKTGVPADGDGGVSSSSSGTSGVSGSSSSGSTGSSSSGTSGTSTSGSSGNDSGTPAPGFGPGPHGSLPSGYCCESDDQCRQRHCEDVAGSGKMCLDGCRSNSPCERPPDFAFKCDNGGQAGADGFCKPLGAAFTCIPASQFERGTKVPGNCCTATGDGTAGLECEGSLCIAIGEGPFVCTNACNLPKDCAGAFTCSAVINNRKECFPANSTYTCN